MRLQSIVGTLAWLAMLLVVQTAQAGRVVLFEVLVDGNVVMNAQLLDQGEDAETAWRYLKTTRVVNPADLYVVSEKEAERLKAFHDKLNAGEPTKATMKGKCRIFCRYAGDISIDEIRLVRKTPKDPWFIDPIQVDDMAKKRTVDPQKRTREQVDRATAEK
jgi:hypothetical protein